MATRGFPLARLADLLPDIAALVYLSRSSWAHVLRALALVAGVDEGSYRSERESAALDGRCSPTGVIVPAPRR